MATIPSGTKFLGVDPTFTDLKERKGTKVDRKSEYFTLEDITATVGVGSEGPQGVEGPAGPPGPVGPAGLEWQGAWDTDSSYAEDDAVGFNGASWFCISAVTGTGNSNPEEDTTHWALLAAQGAQGIQGIQGSTGPQGPQGEDGSSASLDYVSYVAQITPVDISTITVNVLENTLGTTVTVTWVSGKINITLGEELITLTNPYMSVSNYFANGIYHIVTPSLLGFDLIELASYKASGTPSVGWSFGERINFELRLYS
jgi:hypothetical protein